jgi:hypothetical protein
MKAVALVMSVALFTSFSQSQITARSKSHAHSAKRQDAPVTLGELRKKYVGVAVIVTGSLYSSPYREGEYLLQWYLGLKADDRYRADMEHQLPASYKGREARIIALQKDDLQERVLGKTSPRTSVNALGESVSDDSTTDPYTNIVVRFQDGTTAVSTDYPTGFGELFTLASLRDSHAEMIDANLNSVIGRSLYATAMSNIYEPSATLEGLLDRLDGGNKVMSDVPLLAPLTITSAKYFREHDTVVLKLRFPDGRYGLVGTQYRDENWGQGRDAFLGRIAGFLEVAVPQKLTGKEIAAIKRREIFRGMSKDALFYSVGVTIDENDWGKGGKQLIYGDNVLVYLDQAGRVTDWQSLQK